jgi:hypothetical protein
MFFTTLRGTVLALGFLAGATDAVVPVAYAALPIVILLGVLSFLRLVEISVEDVGALRAINRIRAYYGSFALAHAGMATALAVVLGLVVALVMIWALLVWQTARFHAVERAAKAASP